ncbi:hypothetical protein CKAH01_18353 [Colletotrichum kahawae]|uniref:Uncharacterized protein n=1 Tax=Colletotrichum kahawae TaxID=34407 RepID=A0AAD9Y8K8_COLKA|nr:hypothetical protein CKAH01_18353 [Colletotrichum kahawae]
MEITFLAPDHMCVIANCPKGMTDGFYRLTSLWALGMMLFDVIVIDGHIGMYLSSRSSGKAMIVSCFALFIAIVLCVHPESWWFVCALRRKPLEREHAGTPSLAAVEGRPTVS